MKLAEMFIKIKHFRRNWIILTYCLMVVQSIGYLLTGLGK